jgi:anti-sigma factor ChrR (cupin superfamily)
MNDGNSRERLVLRDLFGGFQPENFGAFKPFRPGVEILPLYGFQADGQRHDGDAPSAALLRYSPGSSVPLHEHTDYEHIIVLSGSQEDVHGSYGAGTCVISRPGTRHSVASGEGCLVLAIWHRPVAMLED